MNYGRRQERARLLIESFRDKAKVYPNSTFKGRTFPQVADEIECQTEFGRELVYFSQFILRALDSAPNLSLPEDS